LSPQCGQHWGCYVWRGTWDRDHFKVRSGKDRSRRPGQRKWSDLRSEVYPSFQKPWQYGLEEPGSENPFVVQQHDLAKCAAPEGAFQVLCP